MAEARDALVTRCEARWIGWSVFLLGGASLAFSGFDGLTLASLLVRLGISALIGFVLSWIFCPSRTWRGADGTSGADGSICDGSDEGSCGDGGGDGGGE